MKKMMMALAALCVAGAASAVTWSWTSVTDLGTLTTHSNKGGDTYRQTADLSGKIGEATQWAIQCTMTLGSDYALSNSGYPVLVGIGGTDDNDPRFVIVKESNDIKWSSGVLTGDDIDSNVDAAASGEYTIRFECAKVEGGTAVSVYLNGSEVTTFTYAGTDADFRKITWGSQKDSGDNSNQLDDWTSWTVSNVQ